MNIVFRNSAYGLVAAAALGVAIVVTAPLPLNAVVGHTLVGGTVPGYCIDIAPRQCWGVLPVNECSEVKSFICDFSATTPNTLHCKAKLNQENACGGQPQTYCAPKEYMCQ